MTAKEIGKKESLGLTTALAGGNMALIKVANTSNKLSKLLDSLQKNMAAADEQKDVNEEAITRITDISDLFSEISGKTDQILTVINTLNMIVGE